MTVTVNLSALDELEPVIKELVARQFTAPRWYTLKAACEFKGVSYNTVKCSALLQPGCGKEDATINGRDDNVEDYLRRCRGEK